MQQTQNKTAKQHCYTAQALLVPFFKESIYDMVEHIKFTLFNVIKPLPSRPWGPIISLVNQVMEAMTRMALPAPTVNGLHPALPHNPG